MPDDEDRSGQEEGSRPRRFLARTVGALQRWDSRPGLIAAARAGRRRLPGDHRYGDPLSLTGEEPPQVIARRLDEATSTRPSALREVGMSALQVWQSLSEAQGRGHGDRELAILFTDLVDYSTWALEAGDTQAIELLRCVGEAVEPPVRAHGGRVVKRLGDGLMAVFEDPAEAVLAACEGLEAVRGVEVSGHRPRLRAGVHVGTPRKLGGDYFGVDVNIAARVASGSDGSEVLISEAARERIDPESLSTTRRWRFKAKGAPKDLRVYAAEPA